MLRVFNKLLESLGRPQDQQSETVAETIVYCMFLSFALVVFVLALAVL